MASLAHRGSSCAEKHLTAVYYLNEEHGRRLKILDLDP